MEARRRRVICKPKTKPVFQLQNRIFVLRWLSNLYGYGKKSDASIMTPEQQAREKIDAQLLASGWAVQTKEKINLSAAHGVAICELSFATGEPDYTLFVDGKALGSVEAKPAGHGALDSLCLARPGTFVQIEH